MVKYIPFLYSSPTSDGQIRKQKTKEKKNKIKDIIFPNIVCGKNNIADIMIGRITIQILDDFNNKTTLSKNETPILFDI